jgi:hypothetical protein
MAAPMGDENRLRAFCLDGDDDAHELIDSLILINMALAAAGCWLPPLSSMCDGGDN